MDSLGGISYGYDQIFVGPLADSYKFDQPGTGVIQHTSPSKHNDTNLIHKMQNLESMGTDNKYSTDKYSTDKFINPIYAHAPTCRCCVCQQQRVVRDDLEREVLRKNLRDMQKKHDMFCMFVIFFVVCFLLQNNAFGHLSFISRPSAAAYPYQHPPNAVPIVSTPPPPVVPQVLPMV